MDEFGKEYDHYLKLVEGREKRLADFAARLDDSIMRIDQIKAELKRAFIDNDHKEASRLANELKEEAFAQELLEIEGRAINDLAADAEFQDAKRAAYLESFNALAEGRQLFENYRKRFSELSDKWLLLVQELHDVMNRYNHYKYRCDNLLPNGLNRYHESVGAYVVPRLHNEFFFMDNRGLEQIFTGQRRIQVKDFEDE